MLMSTSVCTLKDQAARVREQLTQFDVELGRWRDQAVGPHPKGMYQVAFTASAFGKIVPWLMPGHLGPP